MVKTIRIPPKKMGQSLFSDVSGHYPRHKVGQDPLGFLTKNLSRLKKYNAKKQV